LKTNQLNFRTVILVQKTTLSPIKRIIKLTATRNESEYNGLRGTKFLTKGHKDINPIHNI